MSGHSKWATIHRDKEANDAKKGVAFTKLAVAITIAVKQGGGIGDPEKNFKLRLTIDKARQYNMPKENIQRAIDRGTGVIGGADLEEVIFEGFAPSGVAVMVQATTDNRMRVAQKIREVFEKNGGVFGSSGSVGYLFKYLGLVRINGKFDDNLELELIDQGIEDIEKDDLGWTIYCEKEKTFIIKEFLESKKIKVEVAELTMKPLTTIECNDPSVENLISKLEDLDDVQKVWSNYA